MKDSPSTKILKRITKDVFDKLIERGLPVEMVRFESPFINPVIEVFLFKIEEQKRRTMLVNVKRSIEKSWDFEDAINRLDATYKAYLKNGGNYAP